MSRTAKKTRIMSLGREDYKKLRQRILQRDGWKCQFCGVASNLEVHHQQFRGRGGPDSELNLITLCAACHRSLHRP
jgi:5-methylcytosine-specific restriction endonuclease McrA